MSWQTTSYSSFQLNFEGVLLLRENNVFEALSCFRRALRVVPKDGQNESRSDIPLQSPPSFERKADDLLMTNRDAESIHTFACLDGPNYDQYDDIFMLYRRALHYSSESLHTVLNYQLLKAVLLYNMGLGYHLLGLQTSSSGFLSEAYDFYSLAYATLSQHCLELPSRLLNLAFLAIANNIGHLHSYLRNTQEVKICTEELSRQLACLLDSGDLSIIAKDNEHRVFFLNVCFYNRIALLAAPCA